jgi:hypothetical protein
MKPLYLDGIGAPLHVMLERTALRVRKKESADQLFPLRRISRIISSGQVGWDTQAMLACADKGITVTFLSRTGRVRARFLGNTSRRSGLPQRMLDLLSQPDWQPHYLQWQSAMEQSAANNTRKVLGLNDPNFRNLSKINRFVHRKVAARVEESEIKQTESSLYGLLLADSNAFLTEIGIDHRFQPARGLCPDLAADFAAIAFWDLRLKLIQPFMENPRRAPHRHKIKTIPRERIVVFYQQHSRETEKYLTGLSLNLYRWIIELN